MLLQILQALWLEFLKTLRYWDQCILNNSSKIAHFIMFSIWKLIISRVAYIVGAFTHTNLSEKSAGKLQLKDQLWKGNTI